MLEHVNSQFVLPIGTEGTPVTSETLLPRVTYDVALQVSSLLGAIGTVGALERRLASVSSNVVCHVGFYGSRVRTIGTGMLCPGSLHRFHQRHLWVETKWLVGLLAQATISPSHNLTIRHPTLMQLLQLQINLAGFKSFCFSLTVKF